jgi:hypothetical protein
MIMNAIRVIGQIDAEHRLTADVPTAIPAGQVEVVVIVPDAGDDPAEAVWQFGVAREWAEDLADERQDIYDISDGQPVDEAR